MAEKDYESAEKLLHESLAILNHLGHKLRYIECLESIGTLRLAQGRLQEARSFFDEVLEIAERLDIPFRIASVKCSLALLAQREDDDAGAIQYLKDAIPIFKRLRSPKADDARLDLERIEHASS